MEIKESSMKFFKNPKTLSVLLAAISLGIAAVFVGGVSANASCLYQYKSSGFNTSASPVFNSICGVPNIGNEPNFVRIRVSSNGNDMDNAHNPAYTSAGLTNACATGTKFDIWNYLHNDASTAYNPDVSPKHPLAVAKDVTSYLSAKTGVVSNSFKFGDMITAYNAKGVSTSVTLNCNGQPVKLKLVSGSVNVFSDAYGKWINQPNGDSYITYWGTKGLKLGANKTTNNFGSGTLWGCWTYRIVVVYQVEVVAVPPVTPPKPATCDLIRLENVNGAARIDVSYSANDATVDSVLLKINQENVTVDANKLPYTFNMTPGNTYNVQAYVNYSLGKNKGSATNTLCIGKISLEKTVNPAPPTQLVNTGPGENIALFIGASATGYFIFRRILKNKLS
jgi:hypothetical protein